MNLVKKLISFPADVIEMVEEYKQKHYITTFTQAVVVLIMKGLESEGK